METVTETVTDRGCDGGVIVQEGQFRRVSLLGDVHYSVTYYELREGQGHQ